jgi:hypothetical protein
MNMGGTIEFPDCFPSVALERSLAAFSSITSRTVSKVRSSFGIHVKHSVPVELGSLMLFLLMRSSWAKRSSLGWLLSKFG